MFAFIGHPLCQFGSVLAQSLFTMPRMASQPPFHYPNPQFATQPAKQSWFDRHRTLAISGIIAGSLLLLLLAAGGFLAFVFSMLRNSTPAQLAFSSAQASPAARAHLGTPITMGWLVTGQINVTNDGGRARLSIPIKGPKASATIYVLAVREEGTWHYRRIHAIDGPWSADFGPLEPSASGDDF
jgi:hypothetical protein